MPEVASGPAAHERLALVQALQQAGAEADTLCEGWNAHDLAVHVAVRDARPDVVFGQKVPMVAARAGRRYQQFEQMSFGELVPRIQAGAPRWSPARLRQVDNAMNTLEFFVHTEDVLRAGPVSKSAPRREVPEPVRRTLWRHASHTMFKAAARKAARRITFLSPVCGAVTHGRDGDPILILEGAPEELVLWAFGRDAAAQVSTREP